MPPNDSANRTLWLIVEAVLAGLLMLTVALLLDVRQTTSTLVDRISAVEIAQAADEADEFTAGDALTLWQAVRENAVAASRMTTGEIREFDRIDKRIDQLTAEVARLRDRP